MQADTQLPTTPPLPGADLVTMLNAIIQTLGTNFSGPNDPASIAWPLATWADTGNMLLKRRNEANTEWVTIGPLLAELQARTPNLDALAGLTGSNGKFAVFTGSGTMRSADIVGPVSMSDDKPSGGIIESGGAGNARYARFADGTLEMTIKNISISTAAQNTWVNSAPFSTPAEFINDGSFVGVAQMYNNPSAQGPVFRVNPSGTSAILLSALSPISGVSGMLVQIIIKARWA